MCADHIFIYYCSGDTCGNMKVNGNDNDDSVMPIDHLFTKNITCKGSGSHC